MRNIAVCIQNENKNVDASQTIKAIAKCGFKSVFVQWYDEDEWKYSQEEQVELCKKLNLDIIFAHLGYQRINSIWLEGEEGDNEIERYKRNFIECKERGIFLVVMHLCGGKNPPMYNEIGLKRIETLVKFAKDIGIKIAFENTRTKGYLEYVFNNIKYDNIGICFDIGHYHVHFNDEFPFEFFKNKILAVHLHDNDKTGDLHLLPFDGTLYWEDTIEKLKKANYEGPVTMELCYRYEYLNNSIEEFYKEGYRRGKILRDFFEKQ